ncbi:MAG: GNAT family N-acetyltransferase [Chloroflexota bacterium]|nr:GNAT family N-acetyltransferase [Chloroflexota bacterium]
METQTAFTGRPYRGEPDLPHIAELINYIDSVEKLDESVSPDELRQWFSAPSIDPQKNIRAWEDTDGRLVALALVMTLAPTETSVDGRLAYYIHPDVAQTGLADEIVAWAETRLREHAAGSGLPGTLYSGAQESYTSKREALERNGFTIARYFFVMHRALDEPLEGPQLPEGFTLSNVAEHPDIDRYVEMHNLAFIDHWGFHPLLPERRAHLLKDPQYKPEGGLLALASDGTFAAYADCYIDAGHNERAGKSEGWIGTLGTRRGYRKMGLGRAMLLAALQWLKRQGLQTGVLDVDAENPTGALRLYESVGFHTVKTEVVYSKGVMSCEL